MTPADHPQWLALLGAVIADPDDAALRLVCADWLEENGDEDRSAFVRVQCELADARCGSYKDGFCEDRHGQSAIYWCPPCQRRRRLQGRERELLDVLRETILGPLCFDGIGSVMWTCRRGFPDQLECTAAAWLAHGPALVLAAPLTRVGLSDKRPFQFYPGPRPESVGWLLGDDDDPYSLPDALFFRLAGGEEIAANDEYGFPVQRVYDPAGTCSRYVIEDAVQANDAAVADLSAACLSWAKAAGPAENQPAQTAS